MLRTERRGSQTEGAAAGISMAAPGETLRMSDRELLDVIRSGSGQRDTKANELFHALVLLVPRCVMNSTRTRSKRGRWGRQRRGPIRSNSRECVPAGTAQEVRRGGE